MIAKIYFRGKSGLHRAGRQVTPGRREPTDSAAENIPPIILVRVKWWGKSSPLNWRQIRHCKPQPEARPNRNPLKLLALGLGRLLEYYGNIISR